MDMRRYRWPDYEMQLLGELQRQQNNAQFCDIVLETEGISVPTHSCILAALSPYLSEKLSASPSPSMGQKCQLQLQAVKAQTLLKLVGLLYSGELEVKGSVEQDDVLSAARQFGITELVEGWKDGGMMEEGEPRKTSCFCCRERNESRKMQDAQVQAEMVERRAAGCPVERKSCVSTGTQTVKAGEKTAGGSLTPSGQMEPATREPVPSITQSMDFSVTLQPQNIKLDKHFNSTYFPPAPIGAPSDGESTVDRSTDSVTNPTSTTAWTSDEMSDPVSLNNDESNSPTLQEDRSYQQSSVSGDRSETELEDEKTNAKMADKRQNAEQSDFASRDEIVGEEKGNCTEKKRVHAKIGKKRLAKMKQMMETTQISIKVKLRRRTKGEVWEVVSVQDADETLSVCTSLKRTDPTNGEFSSVQPSPIHKPETTILQTVATDSSGRLPEPSTPSDSQLLCSECLTPNQSDNLESVLQAPPPGPVEESDEQIEKLLEDIMMGLNILPNLERDCKKSYHIQPSHDGALAACQVPVTENERVQSQMHAGASEAGSVYYQDFGTQIGHSLTDTAQNQPSCSSLTSVLSDAVMTQQQSSPQYDTSVTSMKRRDGMNHQGMPLSRSQNCPYRQMPKARSVIPSAFNSCGQKIHYPGRQQLSSQSDQNILEFLPVSNGSVTQSSHSFSLPYMNELRLPRCLSPLETFASTANYELIINNLTNHRDKMQPQPSLHGRSWLTENPGLLQFPLNAITHPEDTNYCCWSKRWKKHPELNPHNTGNLAESCTVKKVEEGGTIFAHQNAAEVKSNHRNLKTGLKSKEGDTNSDAAASKKRKRKCPSHPQDAAASLLAYKDVKVSDGTKNQINLSVCTVRLSSNNVLAKKREMATSSSNLPKKCLEKTGEMSIITESQTEQTREAGDLKTDQTRIRTRGFLKKTQETPVNAGRESFSVFKPVIRSSKIMYKEKDSLPRRECGRPRKKNLRDTPLTTSEKKSDGVEDEQKMDYSLPKEEEEGEKTKRNCKKRRRDSSEVEIIQLSADGTGKTETNDNSDMIPAVRKRGTPKRPRMVTLKEFQKLIKRQHSKTRKSKESQDKDTNETARHGENDERACGNGCEETGVEVTQPQSRDATKASDDIFCVTVDQNHNQIFNKSTAEYRKSQREDANNSTGEDISFISDENHPVFSFDVLEQEVAKLAAENEQPLKDHHTHEAFDAGVSATMQQTAVSDEGSPHSDTHPPPQEDKTPLEHNLNLQTPERTAPPLCDTVSFMKSSGCDQEEEEEEEEEEVEVDVLLFSPDKVPQSRHCENGLGNMDVSPEEEEDEDVNEIDVTGDEAE